MMKGRLKIIKLAGLPLSEYIDECHKEERCILCQQEFMIGDDMLRHCIIKHQDFVGYKLLENQTWYRQHKDILKPFNPFGDKEEEGEPNSIEYQDNMFQAPRCKKCHHNDPTYDVVSSPPHKGGVKLKCIYCNNISVKD